MQVQDPLNATDSAISQLERRMTVGLHTVKLGVPHAANFINLFPAADKVS